MNKISTVLVLLALLSGCTSDMDQPPLQSDCSFLGDVSDTARLVCGSVQVPENHDKPDGRKISIAYVILKSEDSDTEQYPMIHFTGGPGGQALTNVARLLNNPILKTRDIIRFDQRGIGKSSPLPDLTSKLYGLFPEDLTSEEERERIAALLQELRQTCDEAGIEIEMYNPFQNARDVGMLMDHLGYEKYNLRGGSYGTRIARVVADHFPERIHTAIYDSPAPHRNDYLLTRLEDYSASLRKVLDYCQADPECNERYPDLEAAYFEVLDRLSGEPLEVEFDGKPFFLNAQDAIFFLRYELYKNDSRSLAPRFIEALRTEDLEWINRVVASRGTSTSNYAMFLACENYEEYDHGITSEIVAQKYGELELLPYELPIFTSLYLGSSDFLKSRASREMKEYRVSEIPSLIFINQFDPVTPPENAAIFQSKMTDSRAFIIDAGGHGGGDMECKRKVMDAFMTSPDVELDTECLQLYEEGTARRGS
jgi:pimeloyl-ACP methyl ester carboxylesterase